MLTLTTRGHKHTTPAAATTAPTPLRISTAPHAGDVRLVMHAQPAAPLGQCEVFLGFGSGSKGRGKRIGHDTALYVSTLRRLAAHLVAYAGDYEAAAAEDALPDLAPTCPMCGRDSDVGDLCAWCKEALAEQARAHVSLVCECGRPKPAGTLGCSECIPF